MFEYRYYSGDSDERRYLYNDAIDYTPSVVENAMRCLLKMNKLESQPNFGKLKYEENKDITSKRYVIQDYSDKIDSSFYTDKATATLAYTIYALNDDFFEFGDRDILDECIKYINNDELHDLTNDSDEEFANFEGDESLFESIGEIDPILSLYAYYNEFQLVTDEEKSYVIECLDPTEYLNEIILKKTENINGIEMDFYYVNHRLQDVNDQMLQHEYNMKFLEDRIPDNVLNAIITKYGKNDIMIVSNRYARKMREFIDNNWAAFADWSNGYIVERDLFFTETICHEIGHLFDRVGNWFEDGGKDYYRTEYGIWDKLVENYADDVATIRVNNDISCGYMSDEMKEMHYEFYAEAFQLYFYSPETRAALPEDIRKTIEEEIRLYCDPDVINPTIKNERIFAEGESF